jgi:hypothetical protein
MAENVDLDLRNYEQYLDMTLSRACRDVKMG